MEDQPPYRAGYPPVSDVSEPEIEYVEVEVPVIVEPQESAPPPPPPPPKPPKPRHPAGEEPNIFDVVLSCGAACTKYNVEDTLKLPKRRRGFTACVLGSLVAQFFFLWICSFLLQVPNLFGAESKWEEWKEVFKSHVTEYEHKAQNQTATDIDPEIWKAFQFIPLILYVLIMIIFFRLLNCGRKPPVNWIFVILGYLLLLSSCILLSGGVPYFHHVVAGGFGALIFLLISSLTFLDLLTSPWWLVYVVALCSGFVTAICSSVWFYIGYKRLFEGGSDLELKHVDDLLDDLGPIPGIVIAGFSILVPLYYIHELRQVLRGYRLEVREDEACMISCIL